MTASFSKRRKNDVIPLRSDLAERIKAWLATRPKQKDQEPLIRISNKRTGEILKKDMVFARKTWLASIVDKELRKKAEGTLFPCFVDSQDRYTDFHALRKTFITNLSKSGVSPKMAQSLARHSDINLTMNVYTDVALEDQAVVVELLLELPTLVSAPAPIKALNIDQKLAKLCDLAAQIKVAK